MAFVLLEVRDQDPDDRTMGLTHDASLHGPFNTIEEAQETVQQQYQDPAHVGRKFLIVQLGGSSGYLSVVQASVKASPLVKSDSEHIKDRHIEEALRTGEVPANDDYRRLQNPMRCGSAAKWRKVPCVL